jgi:dihydrofolate reductase
MNHPIALIVAHDRQRCIGQGNALPWHLPADLAHFKRTTLGQPVIMGRKTWDSIGRPLPGRLNLVVSRQVGLTLPGATVCDSLASALEQAEAAMAPGSEGFRFVIGGAQLYAQALPLAQFAFITEVDLDVQGDAHFVALPEAQWQCVEAGDWQPAVDGKPAYRFTRWARR